MKTRVSLKYFVPDCGYELSTCNIIYKAQTWEAVAAILKTTTEGNKKSSCPWEMKISGPKIDLCSVQYKTFSYKPTKLSCCPPLPRRRCEKQILG